MAATVEEVPNRWCPQPWPGPFSTTGLRSGGGGLRQARQGIEFAHNADDGGTTAPRRDKRRRDLRDAGRHRKPRARELFLQQCAAARLLIADLGKRPDLHRDVGIRVGLRVDRSRHRMRVGWLRVEHTGKQNGQGEDDNNSHHVSSL
jgi:hypothetical protein